eukprot:scaffold2533_cov101-Isochrysis_galbana.AAC.1
MEGGARPPLWWGEGSCYCCCCGKVGCGDGLKWPAHGRVYVCGEKPRMAPWVNQGAMAWHTRRSGGRPGVACAHTQAHFTRTRGTGLEKSCSMEGGLRAAVVGSERKGW